MRKPIFYWAVNLLLIATVYLAAEAGRLFGTKELGLPISVIWPATGFSLAALLLFGSKVWPGIFFGNLIYNFIHLYLGGGLFAPLLTAMVISTGALIQALVAANIMKRFNSESYFYSVRDIFIFLIPVTLICCLIASSIGVAALYLYGALPTAVLFQAFVTFWLGDSIGIYVFTPLILVWALQKSPVKLSEHLGEGFLILALFVTLNLFLSTNLHLFIPLGLWATYRFRMHGATLAILVIALLSVVSTTPILPDKILLLVTFLGTTVPTLLILSAIINEREAGWLLLQNRNSNLQETIDRHTQTLKEMYGEIFVKEKLASLGMMTLAISKKIHAPLETIAELAKSGLNALNQLKAKKDPHLAKELQIIESSLQDIAKNDAQATLIAEIAREQADLAAPDKIKVQQINLHTLLTVCLDELTSEMAKDHPDFTFSIHKLFDSSIKTLPVLTSELGYAFRHLFNKSMLSMQEKKNQIKTGYHPLLSITTVNHPDKVEVIIRDNGMGLSPMNLNEFSQSFISEKEPEKVTALDLALVHDIIVHVHHGKLKVASQEGDYLETNFMIPKPKKTFEF